MVLKDNNVEVGNLRENSHFVCISQLFIAELVSSNSMKCISTGSVTAPGGSRCL